MATRTAQWRTRLDQMGRWRRDEVVLGRVCWPRWGFGAAVERENVRSEGGSIWDGGYGAGCGALSDRHGHNMRSWRKLGRDREYLPYLRVEGSDGRNRAPVRYVN